VFHALEETRVQRPGIGFEHTTAHFNTGIGQTLEAAPGDFGVGVLHGRDHPCHACRDQPFGARRGMPVMAARFESDIGRGTPGQLARRAQGVDFGMGLAGAHMPAFADDLPVTHDHTTDPRVGVGGVQAVARQFDGACHVMGV